MQAISSIELSFTAAVVFVGACTDVYSRRVPNWLTLPALAISLVLQGMHGFIPCMEALLAVVIAGGIFLIFFLAGGMGGGDVKLIAAAAAGVGLSRLPALLVFTSLIGGAMAIFLAVRHRRVKSTLLNIASLTAHHASAGVLQPHPELHVRNQQALRLPYAVAIAAGTVLALCAQGVKG
ncbi:MAG: A24 family peptidase [Acidobacteriaceae bacterium]|nr:A24 family peptidase [Acidobacteriaceae bacterium]